MTWRSQPTPTSRSPPWCGSPRAAARTAGETPSGCSTCSARTKTCAAGCWPCWDSPRPSARISCGTRGTRSCSPTTRQWVGAPHGPRSGPTCSSRSAPTHRPTSPSPRTPPRARTCCAWRTGGACSSSRPVTSLARHRSTTSLPSSPTSPTPCSRRRSPWPGPSLPTGSAPCRLAIVAMGKCGGRELNYVSDVDVVFVAEAVDGGDEEAALRTATRLASGLMNVCSVGTPRDRSGRSTPALRPEGKSGALVRTLAQPRRLLRAVGQHVGVPGAAQGPPDRRRRCPRRGLRRRRPAAWCGRPPTATDFVDDVQAMRRRVEESRARRRRPTARSSSVRADCATSSSRCSCSSSCTAAATMMLRSPTTLDALEALCDVRLRRSRRRRQRWRAAYRFLRTARAPPAAAPAAPHPPRPRRRRPTLRRLGRSMGYRTDPVRELDGRVAPARPRGAPAAREAVLPAAAQRRGAPRRRRGQAHPRRGARAARGARLRRSRRARCATSRRSRPASRGARRSSARCCR